MTPLTTVVVGAGDISQLWFPAIAQRDDLALVAVVERHPEVAHARLERHGVRAEVETDLRATLERHRPEVVIDLVFPAARHAVIRSALAAGSHVLCEKPLAATLDEARDLAAAAEAADRIVMVSQNRRWEPNHAAVRDAVASGVLGDLVAIYGDFFSAAHFGGFRAEMDSPLLLDMAVHHLDLARFFTGLDATSVYAEEFFPHGSWYRGAASATVSATLGDGVHLSYRGSWVAEGQQTDHNGHWRIVGSKGSLLYERGAPPRVELAGDRDGLVRGVVEVPTPVPALPLVHQAGALDAFVRAVRGEAAAPTSAADNVETLALVFAAIDSAKTGRRVPVG